MSVSMTLSNQLRRKFSLAMSEMYREEVPQYGTLLHLVANVNQATLDNNPALKASLDHSQNLQRLDEERHGAIRLGTAKELFIMRRLFAIFGMYPVGYYDLSVAGIPVHSTAFRPTDSEALSVNPFRVFTSLLRLDLIADKALREQAQNALNTRCIFSDKLLDMINTIETNNHLHGVRIDDFIEEAINVFRWHQDALIDGTLYQQLHDTHRLLADVVSFKGPHINHLTPATLDIDAIQTLMPEHNIPPKAVVEGPPPRKVPILLRQTSFKALQEAITFLGDDGLQQGFHTARFGEIEQRGIALTIKGQALYDTLLNKTRAHIIPAGDGSNSQEYMAVLHRIFSEFPDDYTRLREHDLAFFHYSLTSPQTDQTLGHNQTIEQLIERGLVRYDPIIYEDFLPVSAAGIFQSNLGDEQHQDIQQGSQQALFEEQLGCSLIDSFSLYQQQQQESINECLAYFQV
ncbi:hypothetical protein IMCC1989_1165 [gamma proteobacterium IMCC1989]|nr:hypothetical protein IMCC1989_1165 [gamma proteobacterium IMCC1989]